MPMVLTIFQPPAEEGNFKQFALGHEYLRRENFLQGKRFPAALVFGANNGRFVGDILRADQPVFQADDVFSATTSGFSPIAGLPCARRWERLRPIG